MEREFWIERWQNDEIGWHQSGVNPLLERYWPLLNLPEDCAVFVPLCGKSLDMRWLESLGHHVFGVELAEKAVREFYAERSEKAEQDALENMPRYRGLQSTIYCTDYLNLTALHLPRVRGVYDRGALVALPPPLRARYADHLQRIIPDLCSILLIVLEYDQSKLAGPPFAVDEAEIRELFEGRCVVSTLLSQEASDLPPKFAAAGIPAAVERVYKIVKER